MSKKDFPLYESLLKRIHKDSEPPNWTRLCPIICNLDEKHSDTIAALIYHYSVIEGTDNDNDLPYNGSTLDVGGGRGCKFIPGDLPLVLQLIIAQYIIMMS